MQEIVMTREEFIKLEKRLDELNTVGRNEIAEKIKEARTFGDLSENAEYNEAMNEQAMMEAEIAQIEQDLANAKIIDTEGIGTEIVQPGAKVKIKNVKTKETEEYTILGKTQADPDNNIISDLSPLGKALIGHKAGETVKVEVPSGDILEFKIVKISK